MAVPTGFENLNFEKFVLAKEIEAESCELRQTLSLVIY